MLYLYTGVPGAGKTLHMVSQLKKDPQFTSRPLYVDGITDLDPEEIPHIALPDGCNGANWHQWLPDGAILIVDECQRYWRTRPNGSRVPDAVQAMETHRHKGVDIYLLTQDAKKIDSAIRGLIEVHKHFSMSQLGVRRCFEWRNKVGDPSSKADVKSAIITPYFLDESVFGLYKSSVQHNEVKAKKSKWIYGLPLMLAAGIGLMLWGLWTAVKLITADDVTTVQNQQPQSHIASQTEQQVGQTSLNPDQLRSNISDGFALGSGTGDTNSNYTVTNRRITPDDYKPDFDGQPWTAPVYAHLNQQIKTMPFPVACVKNGNRCTCYTDQATPIRNMDKNLCIDYAENGIYNPYKTAEELNTASQQSTSAETAQSGSQTAQSAPQIDQMGGKPLPSLREGDSDTMAVIQ